VLGRLRLENLSSPRRQPCPVGLPLSHLILLLGVLIPLCTFMPVVAPMFVFVLVLMPPTTSPGLSGISIPPVRVRPEHSRPINATLPTAIVVAAPLTADQRGVFNGGRSG